MDPFDDLFAPAATHARAGGKFQPKVKHRPRKQALAPAPSVVPSDTKERAGGLSSPSSDAGQLILPTAVVDEKSKFSNAIGLSSSGINGVEESLKKPEDSVSGVPEGIASENPSSEVGGPKEDRGSMDVFHQVGGVEMTNGVPEGSDGHSGSRTPVDFAGLGADHFINSGVEPPSISAGVSSEQEISASAPSTFPNAIVDKLVTPSTNGSDIEASVQPINVGKSTTEGDSLQFVVDPFGDILSESATSATRSGHKFRPKMKSKPQKGATKGVASALPNPIERPVTLPVLDSVQSVQSVETGNSTLTERIDSSLATSEILGSRKAPVNDGYPCSNVSISDNTRSLEEVNPSQSHATDALQSEVSVPNATGDWHSSLGKSLGENVDLFSGLEYLDDFITQTTSGTGSEASRSQCKVVMDIQHEGKFLTSYSVNDDLGGSVLPSDIATHSEENFSAPAHGSFESSALTGCDLAPSQTCSNYHTTQNTVTFSETAISGKHEKVQINNARSETKVSETLFDFQTCQAPIASGKRAGKFQPRPKLGKGKEKPSTTNPQADVRSALPSEAVDFVPLDNGFVHEGSISDFPREDVVDYSYIDPTPEIQGDTEPKNLTEATQSDGTILGDMHSEDPGVLGMGGKSRFEEACAGPNHPRKNKKSSTASEGVEVGKSSMQLRKRLRRSVDEPVDETYDVNDSEPPSTSNTDEDEDNDDEYRVDRSTSRKKKAPRKVKEPASGNEKPSRKRKSTKEASDGSAKEPPKKFSHSTRRSKRRVDKALLETPEDEIDPQRLPIKDLILLAEHRERTAIKDAAKLKTPQTNQSAENSFRDDASYNEDETFFSEQGQCSDDDQANYKVQPSSSYVNYQSFMEKTPSTRWSKQDTELFYEAVRQFGTDFSLIQQLFPGRTRNQVKLKFKKEERQHPFRLSEAVTNRAKDHSHFESVIERLQQAAAQEKQEPDGNESTAVTGEEVVEEPADDTNEGVTKSEWKNEAVKDQDADDAEVDNSPLKQDESDDDLDRWGQYNY